MQETDLKRRRELLTKRLKEQIKTFNRKSLLQILNYLFFIFIILPIILGGLGYLFVNIFSSAIDVTQIDFLLRFKDGGISFLTTNSLFHMIIVAVFVVVVLLMILHYWYTRIDFNAIEMALAGYILTNIKQNQVISYQAVHKEIEFRGLTFTQIDKVAYSLHRLQHVYVDEKDDISQKIIIRNSDW